jgi:hypothetical protein
LALAKREHFRVNVIEAFDQPWKRWLEGSVGGHWGVFDRATGAPKFDLSGGAVSDHPHWLIQALAGILLAGLAFGSAFVALPKKPPAFFWWRIAALSFLPAVLFGWTIETIPVDSFTVGGWMRSLAQAAVALGAPIVCAMGCAREQRVPTFSTLLSRLGERQTRLSAGLGVVFLALFLLAVEIALGLSFDPRYRDIPFAPLCAGVVPFLVLFSVTSRPAGSRAKAELTGAFLLAAAAVYIALNEGFANWQALWLSADLVCLAFILALARDAPD